MSIQDDVIRVLSNQYTRRINFTFERLVIAGQGSNPALTVNPSTFERVTAAIRSGRITVRQIPVRGELAVLADGRTQRIGGRFQRATNVLAVPEPVRRYDQAVLVHETVHASLHLTGSSLTTWAADNEAAAYIAGHLYFIYTGLRHRSGNPNSHSDEMHRIAHRCARQIIANGRIEMMTLERLCEILRTHPGYRDAMELY